MIVVERSKLRTLGVWVISLHGAITMKGLEGLHVNLIELLQTANRETPLYTPQQPSLILLYLIIRLAL